MNKKLKMIIRSLCFFLYMVSAIAMTSCNSQEQKKEPRREAVTSYGQAVQKAKSVKNALKEQDDNIRKQAEQLKEE